MKKLTFKICVFFFFMLCFSFANAKTTALNEEINKMDYMNIPFWEHFKDETLIENLYSVYKNNNDLKATALKVNEVKRLVKMSFANELPYLGFNGYAGYVFNSSDELFGSVTIPNYHEAHFLFPLTYNYEVDLWGKNHLKTKSQKKSFEMIKQDEKSVYISLTSAFANVYFNLIKADELIKYQRKIIETHEKYADNIKKRYEIGTSTINDVIESEKALTYLKEELENYLEKQDVLQNQLSVMLSDRAFDKVKRSDYQNLNVDIKIPDEIDVNILQNRPDRIRAELNLEKNGINIQIAKRDFLPTFTILGNIGFNFYNLSSAHTFLSDIGVVPNFDIFAGGKKIAMLKMQKDKYNIAIEEYEKTILKSIQETNDSLYILKSNHKKNLILDERTKHDENEFHLTELKQNIGMADDMDLLIKKERLLVSKKQQVSSKINEVIAMIQLYQALGGIDYSENTTL